MSTPKPNATPAEMAELYKLNQRLYGTKPEIKPQKPSADQRRYDNLASRTNRSPSQQRLMDRLGGKLEKANVAAVTNYQPITELPRDLIPVDKFGPQIQPRQKISAAEAKKIANMQKSPKMLTPQTVPTLTGEELAKKLNTSNFQGDTRVPNVNTIGFPAPAGPGPGLMGGGNPPPATNFQPGMGGNIGGSAAGTPAGMNMLASTNTYQNNSAMGSPTGSPTNFFNTPTAPPPAGAAFKKGGAVKAKKMASGGMTAKASPARRGDGIAQRGKTKGRMV